MALAQPLLVRAQDQRNVGELGNRRLEGLVEQELLGRIRDVIVAAHDVRDPHLDIVGDDRQVVRGMAVRSQEDEVFDVCAIELDRAVHEVVEARGRLRHPEPDRARDAIAFASGDVGGASTALHTRSYRQVPPCFSVSSRLACNSAGVQ